MDKQYPNSLASINHAQRILQHFNHDLSEDEYSFKAQVLMAADLYQPAIEIWISLLAKERKEEYLSNLGWAYWYAGDLKKALFYYESYSGKIKNLSPDWYNSHGQVLAELGKYEEAEAELTYSADNTDSHEVQAYSLNGRGFARGKQKKFTEALEDFETSLNICPDNAWTYFNRARIREDMNKTDLAIQDYAVSLEKDDPALPLFKKDYATKRLSILKKNM
jgi:tetratricopeptide (TPR) repeat protein